MNINEVASHAAVTFSPRAPASPAPVQPPVQPIDPQTGRARDAATSSPAVQTQQAQQAQQAQQQVQQAQTALAGDPSARNPGEAEKLQTAVEKIQEFIRETASDIEFSIDEDSGRTVVKVIDRETEDIIRQIPSQEMLDLAKALDKLQGLLIRQKA
jgi:flagellar protein FlaG